MWCGPGLRPRSGPTPSTGRSWPTGERRRRAARAGARPGGRARWPSWRATLPGPARAVTRPLPGPTASGHIPFTPRAKKSLELSLREAKALHDDYIGVQHLVLAQLAISDGMPRTILSALGVSSEALRAAILARYRKAS